LNIEYAIGDINFKIPPLTLQPIVENAVKHGIFKRKGGGTVRISIQAKDKMHEICVDDDGVGFDINSFPADGIQHIGMKNVRERLYLMCHGNLDIQSIPGKGTWIKIQIPDDWY
jgi:sensor histidine kinase YesM